MNDDGHKQINRVTADVLIGPDWVATLEAVDQAGNPIPHNRRRLVEQGNEGTARWRYVWNGLPADSVVFRIVTFSEGGGYWTPVLMPEFQSDAMLSTVETLLNLSGLSLLCGIGLKMTKGLRS
jgi:hypothetical protein